MAVDKFEIFQKKFKLLTDIDTQFAHVFVCGGNYFRAAFFVVKKL